MSVPSSLGSSVVFNSVSLGQRTSPPLLYLLPRVNKILSNILTHAWTLVLFTYTDFKTIFIPVSVFSSVCAPVSSWDRFFHGAIWIWLHLLQCNVSNQYKTVAEDLANRPWRPIPSGRISQYQATVLRWAVCIICIALSATYGWDVAITSAALTLTMIVYDEFKLSGHWMGKNICAVSGYLTFEVGATKIMGSTSELDNIAVQAVLFSTSIILTTIHAQDFPDVEGDRVLGRITIPIYAPEASRIFTFIALLVWSVSLGWLWNIGYVSHALLSTLGGYVGWRYYHFREGKDDGRSYRVYNFWLMVAHLLPLHARWDLLAL